MTTSFPFIWYITWEQPYQDARVEGEKLAKLICRIGKGRSGWFYNGLEGYYNVLGHNKKRRRPYYWKRMTTKDLCFNDKGVSQRQGSDDFEEKELTTLTHFWSYQDKPIWEVKSGKTVLSGWLLKQNMINKGIWNYPSIIAKWKKASLASDARAKKH